uniref:Ig-like domain-containing protein n=1 Tax=Pelodiscus sinensis TaxID=13735 RepID=K7FA39_PELSI
MAPTWLPVVLVSALLSGMSRADSVTQTEGSVDISQGDPLSLNCTYQFSVTYPPYPFWYVQYPGETLRMLLRDLGRQDSDEGIRKGFNATHEKENKSFHLWKASVDLSDSATYYCAASDTVTRTGSGAAQKPRRD